MKKKIKLMIAAVALLMMAASCSKDDPAPVQVSGITLNKTELTLAIGSSETLTATVNPDNAADKTVTWTSSATGVATVENGVITAVAVGSATITATSANGKTARCEVTVEVAVVEVESITLEPAPLNLYVGDSETLTATVNPDNATDKTITWQSSDTEVATVTDGVVPAIAAGTATITATSANGKTATCDINVAIRPTIEFTFTGTSIEFGVMAQSMTVDWGDGVTNYSNSHTYQNNANHTVRIYAEGLTFFECYGQRLTTLDVSNCTALTELYCYDNQLTSLDVSNCTALTELDCSDNQLTSLDVSNCTALTELYCWDNQLSALDVSKNTALILLDCGRNPLVSLDVSNNTELQFLFCFDNQLDANALDELFDTLPTVQSGDIDIRNNPGTNGCDRSIAIARGWVFR
ncbi:MAG: Ig-like domain-containing protein [Prevotellaceae bacterium]|jgi:uncharacterized protein YjdB|nr:Ig-like domain-containing protein [Prevotellaceae bacterium]